MDICQEIEKTDMIIGDLNNVFKHHSIESTIQHQILNNTACTTAKSEVLHFFLHF